MSFRDMIDRFRETQAARLSDVAQDMRGLLAQAPPASEGPSVRSTQGAGVPSMAASEVDRVPEDQVLGDQVPREHAEAVATSKRRGRPRKEKVSGQGEKQINLNDGNSADLLALQEG